MQHIDNYAGTRFCLSLQESTLTETTTFMIYNNTCKSAAISKLELCVKDIKAWSTANYFKLNEDKTEVLHIKSRFRKPTDLSNIQIGDSTVESTSCAQNLGVQFEDNLSMEKHVNNVCRAASFALHKLGQIRKYLDKHTTEKLVHAFVTCSLDNCNNLFYGLPDKLIAKLQRTQNSAARLVTLTKSRDHISPILRDLHWLPVKSRIMYKILLLTYMSMVVLYYIFKNLFKCTNRRANFVPVPNNC